MIECKLAGIQPQRDKWSENSIDAFGSRVWKPGNEFITLDVQFCGLDHEDKKLHLIVLKDPAAPEELSINQWLVKEGKAHWNNMTSHLLPR